jgi:hypothetical protein
MRTSKLHNLGFAGMIAAIGLGVGSGPGDAYEQFSQNGGDATNCGECHGNFRSGIYISQTDGTVWSNLHNLHRNTMLDGDCETCHSADDFPVFLNQSLGGDGLAPISCMGCHGRNEDNVAANPQFPNGLGAGLRQHHFTAGVTRCLDCHDDADPANYTAVGEDVFPEYYANPGAGHPNMPTDPCNADGSEDFAGISEGLDNDGDDDYDGLDADCLTGVGIGKGIGSDSVIRLSISPNPVSSGRGTEIVFSLPDRSDVTIAIHETEGRLVQRQELTALPSGVHRVRFDGRDREGRPLPSGVYFVRVQTAVATEIGRIVLIR